MTTTIDFDARCMYFGCWGRPGHGVFTKNGRPVDAERANLVSHYSRLDEPPVVHIDGTLAPRLDNYGRVTFAGALTANPRVNWPELPQGHFLRTVLSNGFTAIAWWDRTQGDTRPHANSVLLLEGRCDTATMLVALNALFPRVVKNLERAGIQLTEVHAGQQFDMREQRVVKVRRCAYLVAHVSTKRGEPYEVVCTGIYTEPAKSLTGAIGKNVFAFDVLDFTADTFEEACLGLKGAVDNVESVYGWAMAMLKPNDKTMLEDIEHRRMSNTLKESP